MFALTIYSYCNRLMKIMRTTGVARNFDWERPKIEKSCDLSLVTFIGDVITMTSLKWRNNWFFKVWFSSQAVWEPQFGQITQFQVTKIEDQGALVSESPQRLAIFGNLLLK